MPCLLIFSTRNKCARRILRSYDDFIVSCFLKYLLESTNEFLLLKTLLRSVSFSSCNFLTYVSLEIVLDHFGFFRVIVIRNSPFPIFPTNNEMNMFTYLDRLQNKSYKYNQGDKRNKRN